VPFSTLPPVDLTCSPSPAFFQGVVMNTAVARRLALGDRVIWIGNESPSGTINRITAHEVEVRWDGGTMARYRRMHLHNLRHVKLISDLVESGRRATHSISAVGPVLPG
jgi:hypothetical protein